MPALSAPPAFRGIFREDEAARGVYSEAAGIAQILPRAIAVPVDANDVVSLVRWAVATGSPLVPRGSGSSMAGGAIGDGVVVDLSRLVAIGDIDATARRVRCGPGALRDDVDAAARAVGLQFPVDPSSGAYCTVGGMAATNSAGAHSMRHGATRHWVEALDCVFTDGSRAELRRGAPAPDVEPVRRVLQLARQLVADEGDQPSVHPGVRKESSGYGLAAYAASGDLVDLLVGSEGTLALIVGVELRLCPRFAASASVLGAFSTLESAVRAAGLALAAQATACELLDRTFLDVARGGGARVPVDLDTEAVLLAEVEGDDRETCSRLAASLAQRFRDAGATDVVLALDATAERTLWELRHAASPILSRLDPALRSMQFIEDGCVPPARLAEYVRGVRAALARQEMRGVIFGHAGDAHVHVNPLVDLRAPEWRSRVAALLAEVTALVASLGGTLSGEHGDGRLRAPLLGQVWSGAALARFAAVKHAFDPLGLLNPGAKMARPGTDPIGRVKYDPALPALHPDSRRALERVERDRAYASFRLDMLGE